MEELYAVLPASATPIEYNASIDAVQANEDGSWTIDVRDIQLVLPFLISPKVGDHLVVTRTPLIFSVVHKNVVIHSEARVPVGTKIYSRGGWSMSATECIAEGEEGCFSGTDHSQWEDSRGNVHRGQHRFLVKTQGGSSNDPYEFPLLDVDKYWTLEAPLTSLDHILMNWDSGLV